MAIRQKTWKRGLRLWLVVFASWLLTTALFLAPYLAGRHDFGHSHPESMPEHVHSIEAVLGAALEVAPVTPREDSLGLVLVIALYAVILPAVGLPDDRLARAPPFSLKRPPKTSRSLEKGPCLDPLSFNLKALTS